MANSKNALGAKAFTTIGYKLLEASSIDVVTTLFEGLDGKHPLFDALKYILNREVLQEYSRHHNPKSTAATG